jgi:FkbM family methyltransferase
MHTLKKTVKNLLRNAGWDVMKVDERRNEILARATMKGALKWIGDQKIPVTTVLDVGASNGCWTEECMTFVNAGSYVLFEPQPVHTKSLDAFARKSPVPVQLVRKAVGAIQGVTFFDASEALAGALSDHAGENMIEVPVTTIDHTVREGRLEGPFLLKLDTHGYEPSILEGAKETLHQCSVIIIEAYNFRISNEAILFWELCAFLARQGFRCVDLVDVLHRELDSALWQMDLVFIRDDWDGFSQQSYK